MAVTAGARKRAGCTESGLSACFTFSAHWRAERRAAPKPARTPSGGGRCTHRPGAKLNRLNPDAHTLWRAPRWALAVLLACLGMLGPFSIDTYLPAFTGIANAIGATPVQMQQTLSAYLFGFAVMNLFHGALSDSCLLYTSPSPRDGLLSRMPSSA